jgi:hypothetical protein
MAVALVDQNYIRLTKEQVVIIHSLVNQGDCETHLNHQSVNQPLKWNFGIDLQGLNVQKNVRSLVSFLGALPNKAQNQGDKDQRKGGRGMEKDGKYQGRNFGTQFRPGATSDSGFS